MAGSMMDARSTLAKGLAQGNEVDFREETIDAAIIRDVILGIGIDKVSAGVRSFSQAALRVTNAQIEGRLELDHLAGPGGAALPGLIFTECTFLDGIGAANSHISSLSLIRCRFKSTQTDLPTINLSGVGLDSDLLIDDAKPREDGSVCWIEARNSRIDGDVIIHRSEFRVPPKRDIIPITGTRHYAVSFRGCEILGRIECLGGMIAHGGISIRDAHVHGDAWFSGSCVTADEGGAFEGQSARVGGVLGLDTRRDLIEGGEVKVFSAIGGVSLMNAEITGGLLLDGIQIRQESAEDFALNLYSLKTDRSVSLRYYETDAYPPVISGRISLGGSIIGQSFLVDGLVFGTPETVPGTYAIVADFVEIGHQFVLANISPMPKALIASVGDESFEKELHFHGQRIFKNINEKSFDRYSLNGISIANANINELLMDRSSIISGGLYAGNVEFFGNAILAGTIFGDVVLEGATVNSGSLDITGLTLACAHDGSQVSTLNLRDADIEKSLKKRADLPQVGTSDANFGVDRLRMCQLESIPDYAFAEILWSGEYPRMSGFLIRTHRRYNFAYRLFWRRPLTDVLDPDGRSDIFHWLSDRGWLRIDSSEKAVELARIFCGYLVGDGGVFRMIESADALPSGTIADRGRMQSDLEQKEKEFAELDPSNARFAEAGAVIEAMKTFNHDLWDGTPDTRLGLKRILPSIEPLITPISCECNDEGTFAITANILYRDRIFRSAFLVEPSAKGQPLSIKMDDDVSLTGPLNIPIRSLRNVIEGSDKGQWPLTPCLPEMRELEGRELRRLAAMVKELHPDLNRFGDSVIDLRDAKCDSLLDGGGYDWGSGVTLKLDRFTYRHFEISGELPAALSSPRNILKLAARRYWFGVDHDAIAARKHWIRQCWRPNLVALRVFGSLEPSIMQSMRIFRGTRNAIKKLQSNDKRIMQGYQPQPFYQAIKAARQSGQEEMAVAIEIWKFWLEGSIIARKYRKQLFVFGAILWLLAFVAIDGARQIQWPWILASTLAFASIFNVANLSAKWMFGYFRRPVRALTTMVAACLIGWLGVHTANENNRLVIDVQPTAPGLEASQKRFASPVIQGRTTQAVACASEINELLYAIDVFIPLVDLRQESRCTVDEVSGETVQSRKSGEERWFSEHSNWLLGTANSETLDRQVERVKQHTIHSKVFWEISKAIYAILGWIIVSLSILTFARIDRRLGEE